MPGLTPGSWKEEILEAESKPKVVVNADFEVKVVGRGKGSRRGRVPVSKGHSNKNNWRMR